MPIKGCADGDMHTFYDLDANLERIAAEHLQTILNKNPALATTTGFTCLDKKLKKISCSWTIVGEQGTFACQGCVVKQIPCLRAISGTAVVLPLPAVLVPTDCPKGSQAYHVYPDSAKAKCLANSIWVEK